MSKAEGQHIAFLEQVSNPADSAGSFMKELKKKKSPEPEFILYQHHSIQYYILFQHLS